MNLSAQLENVQLDVDGMEEVTRIWHDLGPVVRSGDKFKEHIMLIERLSDILEAHTENKLRGKDPETCLCTNGLIYKLYLGTIRGYGIHSNWFKMLQVIQVVINCRDFQYLSVLFRHLANVIWFIPEEHFGIINEPPFTTQLVKSSMDSDNPKLQTYALLTFKEMLLLKREQHAHLIAFIEPVVEKLMDGCHDIIGDLKNISPKLSNNEVLLHDINGPWLNNPPTNYTLVVSCFNFLHAVTATECGLQILLRNNVSNAVWEVVEANINNPERSQLVHQCLKIMSKLVANPKLGSLFISRGGLKILLQTRKPSLCVNSAMMCLTSFSVNQMCMDMLLEQDAKILEELTAFLVWSVAYSHRSGKSYAIQFLHQAFSFRAILVYFDKYNGLKSLLNNLRQTPIISDVVDSIEKQKTINSIRAYPGFPFSQLSLLISVVRKYLYSHLFFQLNSCENRIPHGMYPNDNEISWNACIYELYCMCIGYFKLCDDKLPSSIKQFNSLDGMLVMFLAVTISNSLYSVDNREMLCQIFQIVAISCLHANGTKNLIKKYPNANGKLKDGFKILFDSITPGHYSAQLQLGLLQIIANCVSTVNKKLDKENKESIIGNFRHNHGIKFLGNLFSVADPPFFAASINALAGFCLLQLSKDKELSHLIKHLENCQLNELRSRLRMSKPFPGDKNWYFILQKCIQELILGLGEQAPGFHLSNQVEEIKEQLAQLGLFKTLEVLTCELTPSKNANINVARKQINLELHGADEIFNVVSTHNAKKPLKLKRKIRSQTYGNRQISSCVYSFDMNSFYMNCGTSEIKILNTNSFKQRDNMHVSFQTIDLMQISRDDNFLLAFSIDDPDASCLLYNLQSKSQVLSLADELTYANFNNENPREIIGTHFEDALLYDTTTGKMVHRYASKVKNCYKYNMAVVDKQDEMILCDGNLYCRKSGLVIHHFDKFYDHLSGEFNPFNQYEVISESIVWDTRTFKVLRNEQHLKKSFVKFDYVNRKVYACRLYEAQNNLDVFCDYIYELDSLYSVADVIYIRHGKIQDFIIAPDGSQLAVFQNDQPTGVENAMKNWIEIFCT